VDPYGTRARKRIWKEALTFVKGRVVPFGIAIAGLILGYLINYLYLHRQTAKELTVIGLASLVGSYVTSFLISLVVNAVRVPWLLDAESGQQINTLEARALQAESKLDDAKKIKEENKRLHDFFGDLMHEGIAISITLASCTTESQLASWDVSRDEWLIRVKTAIKNDLGYASDAAEFIRAGDNAEFVDGPMDWRGQREDRNREFAQYQLKLEEIVRRRLP